MGGGGGEKTEKPTPQRRRKARKDGHIARTNDLGAWATVLAATWLVPIAVAGGFERCRRMIAGISAVAADGPVALPGFLADAILGGTLVMAPMVLLALVIGVGGQVAQIGWAPKKLKVDVKKLNLLTGIKGLFGMRTVWEAGKNVLKLAIIVYLAAAPIGTAYETLVRTSSGMSVPGMAAVIATQTVAFLRTVAMAGLVLAVADYAQSRRQVGKQTRMSRQEIKEEHKQSDGDPQVRGQIRARQMAMSRNRMMADVPRADLVLVNPTHIAIALRYDPVVGAPVVLAKGAGAVADRIRELAAESAIPIVRDVPLARTVYRLVDVGRQIPVELYEAVARVLAFVYSLRARGRAAGTHDSPFATTHAPLVELERHPSRTPTPVP